jgi:hypothetical protein
VLGLIQRTAGDEEQAAAISRMLAPSAFRLRDVGRDGVEGAHELDPERPARELLPPDDLLIDVVSGRCGQPIRDEIPKIAAWHIWLRAGAGALAPSVDCGLSTVD